MDWAFASYNYVAFLRWIEFMSYTIFCYRKTWSYQTPRRFSKCFRWWARWKRRSARPNLSTPELASISSNPTRAPHFFAICSQSVTERRYSQTQVRYAPSDKHRKQNHRIRKRRSLASVQAARWSSRCPVCKGSGFDAEVWPSIARELVARCRPNPLKRLNSWLVELVSNEGEYRKMWNKTHDATTATSRTVRNSDSRKLSH